MVDKYCLLRRYPTRMTKDNATISSISTIGHDHADVISVSIVDDRPGAAVASSSNNKIATQDLSQQSQQQQQNTASDTKSSSTSIQSFVNFFKFVAQHDLPVEKLHDELTRFVQYIETRILELPVLGDWRAFLHAFDPRKNTDSQPVPRAVIEFAVECSIYLSLLFAKTDLFSFIRARIVVLFHLLQKHELVRQVFMLKIPTEMIRMLKLHKFLRTEEQQDNNTWATLAVEFVHFLTQLTNPEGVQPFANPETFLVANQLFSKKHTLQARERYQQFKHDLQQRRAQSSHPSAEHASLFRFIGNSSYLNDPFGYVKQLTSSVSSLSAPVSENKVRTFFFS